MAEIVKRQGSAKPRYVLRVYVGRDSSTGKRKYIVRSFGSRKEADKEGRRLEGLKDGGVKLKPSKQKFGEYLNDWLAYKEGRVRARTLAGYRGHIHRYVQTPPAGYPTIGMTRLDRLTPAAFEDLYRYMWKDCRLKPTTVQGLHTVLRQALKRAVHQGMLARNPTDGASPADIRRDEKTAAKGTRNVADLTGRGTEKKWRAMDEAQATAFLTAAREDHHYALWAVLVTGGLRPSEAFGLAWSDVDLEGGTLTVERSLTRVGVVGWALVPPKTEKGYRTVELPPVTVDALREWATAQKRERLRAGSEYTDHGFVFTSHFGEPLDGPNLLSRNFNALMAKCGFGTWQVRDNGKWVPEGVAKEPAKAWGRRFRSDFRMYDLRHTCATLLLKRGVNPKIVSARLGHAKVAFTLDVYSHVLPSMGEVAAEELQAVFGQP